MEVSGFLRTFAAVICNLTFYRYGNNKKEKNPRRGESRIQGDDAQEKRAHGGKSEKNRGIGTTRLFCITTEKPLNLCDYEHTQIGKHQSACTV